MAGKPSAKPQGEELGVGYVSLTVDTAKMGQEIEEELGAAGQRGGKKAGDNTSSALKERLGEGAKVAGVAAGAVAATALAVGMKDAMAQADLPGTIQAQLGTTPEFAKEIAEAAGGAYSAGWGESLEEVGKTASDLGQILNTLGDPGNIEELTVKATALAGQFDQDTAALANSAGNLVKNGMAASMDEAFDLMTVGFQTNQKLSEDFLDSVDEYGESFQTMGLTGADVLGMMNQGLDAGAWNSDVIADGLREFMILAQEMPESTAEAFKAVGLDASKMQADIAKGGPGAKAALQASLDALRGIEDPAARATAAVGLFGPKAEEMQGALFALDPSKAAAGMGDLSGKSNEFVNNAAGFDQTIAGIGRTLSMGLGEAITPLLPMLKDLAGVGLVFFRWLAENPVVTGILLGVAGAIGAIAAAQWVWNAAQLANPMTWVMLGILAGVALLVGGIIWLTQNWDTAMDAMGHGVNGLVHGLNGFIHGLNGIARAIEWILTAGGNLGKLNWGTIPTMGLPFPGLQTGGTITGSGSVLVGEAGPEILQLPRGASVIPLDHPAALPEGGSGGHTINLTTINPVAEKTSVTTRKASQLLGASLV